MAASGIEPTDGDPCGFPVRRPNHLTTVTAIRSGTLKDNQRDKTVFCTVTAAGGPVCVTAR